MITKAIVEKILSQYKVKVRVPLLDRSLESSLSTKTENLTSATICCLPNCYPNPQVGDVVFVAFEDNSYDKAVIIGHLSREENTSTYSDMIINSVNVMSNAELPSQTSIGAVTPENINCLSGIVDNIQKQINHLQQQIDNIVNNS